MARGASITIFEWAFGFSDSRDRSREYLHIALLGFFTILGRKVGETDDRRVRRERALHEIGSIKLIASRALHVRFDFRVKFLERCFYGIRIV